MTRTIVSCITALLVGAAFCCSPPRTATSDGADEPEQAESNSTSLLGAPKIPMLGGGGLADDCYEPTDPCAFALAHDAIAFGTITDLRLRYEPVVSTDGGTKWEYVEASSCDEVLAALEIDLDVDRALGAQEAEVTITVGPWQWDGWRPYPALSASGALEWKDGDPTRALGIGDRIGAPIWKTATGRWSPLGSPLFAVLQTDDESAATVLLQHHDPARCSELVRFDGLTLDELFAVFQSCIAPNEDAVEWHESNASAPPYSYLPVCYRRDPAPDECSVDADCMLGYLCEGTTRHCVPMPPSP